MTSCKEYLMPSRNYEYILTDAREALEPHAEDWIEIPEGAVKLLFSKENGSNYHFANENNQLMSLTDINYGNPYWYGNAKNYMSQCKVDFLWQRDQDEPFLTPECTLNDQYAEIEQVRQAINKSWGSVGAASGGATQASGGVDETLSQRQSQYGCYEDVAHVTQQILSALRIGNYENLPAPMKESLHMIASKMARIVNGDPEYLDNWHDIGGYAKLIEKLIKGE